VLLNKEADRTILYSLLVVEAGPLYC